MDELVPTPIVFPVAGRVYLSEANDDPSCPEKYTMNLVIKIIVHSLTGEVAGTNGRESLRELKEFLVMIILIW